MNEKQLKIKQRVLALLPDQDTRKSSLIRGIESLSNSPVSGGIASYPDNGEDVVGLVEIADKALYEAKFSGKDCCIVGTSPEPETG